MTITITIDTDTLAFGTSDESIADEIRRILLDLSDNTEFADGEISDFYDTTTGNIKIT